jgi:hypothetical protein
MADQGGIVGSTGLMKMRENGSNANINYLDCKEYKEY